MIRYHFTIRLRVEDSAFNIVHTEDKMVGLNLPSGPYHTKKFIKSLRDTFFNLVREATAAMKEHYAETKKKKTGR
jgi:hypothetical protein